MNWWQQLLSRLGFNVVDRTLDHLLGDDEDDTSDVSIEGTGLPTTTKQKRNQAASRGANEASNLDFKGED